MFRKNEDCDFYVHVWGLGRLVTEPVNNRVKTVDSHRETGSLYESLSPTHRPLVHGSGGPVRP